MLKKIYDNLEQIDKVMHEHHIKEWKIFGPAINQTFPIIADIHFLIVPDSHSTWQTAEALVHALDDLFDACTQCYTLNSLQMKVTSKDLPESVFLETQTTALDAHGLRTLFEAQQQSEQPVTTGFHTSLKF